MRMRIYNEYNPVTEKKKELPRMQFSSATRLVLVIYYGECTYYSRLPATCNLQLSG